MLSQDHDSFEQAYGSNFVQSYIVEDGKEGEMERTRVVVKAEREARKKRDEAVGGERMAGADTWDGEKEGTGEEKEGESKEK